MVLKQINPKPINNSQKQKQTIVITITTHKSVQMVSTANLDGIDQAETLPMYYANSTFI